MYRRTSLAIVATIGALLVAAPASADSRGADRLIADQPRTAMLDARERALVAKAAAQPVDALEARERALGVKYELAQTAGFAQAIQSPKPEPVRDDRFRLDPTTIGDPITASTSGREIEWPQIGIGLVLGLALALGVFLAVRPKHIRPLTR